MKRVHVFIHGFVQGVFFRRNTKKLADKLGIKGFVRNVDDGVEAVFEGKDDTVEEIIGFCRRGPPGAEVDKLDINEEEYRGEFKIFEIR